MKLYLARHAPAQDRTQYSLSSNDDSLRPLTKEGILKMRNFLNKISPQIERPQIVLQSPLTRCQQTGEIYKEFFPESRFELSDHLKPNSSLETLLIEILSHSAKSLLVIGHEPDLGQFISWLLTTKTTLCFPLKKSGLARVDIKSNGSCQLKWIIQPKLFL